MSRAKVMISMPEEFLAEIDEAAKAESRSRSEFIREAARLYLEMGKARLIPGQNSRIQRAIATQDALARQDSLKEWDSAAAIRQWRENR